ncbi:MAG: 2-phospho-L-lactate transferase [Betaproteobacteria bacterium RIFCSPLOWO2_02_FULL_62_17]|nr:MAG: 2-phospho-L-lactate transferase [Betaproteobacteria bacterium RIFCSPLOWO2_02_FULL_62_17]
MILTLAGGVGGAKLAQGLYQVLGDDLTVVVNTGDDFEHMGLCISPDLDTVMYTLAGLNNRETGWGLAGETWNFMAMTGRLGGETWFRLGDQDLAVHLERTRRLAAGETLSSVTASLCARLGLTCAVMPMSNARVRTMVGTDRGELAFQDYFVRLRCEPRLRELRFDGADAATMSPAVAASWESPALRAIVLAPSNPFLSIAPILAVPGFEKRLRKRRVPVVAVSPIVGGKALKGPAAKIMQELEHEVSALAVARHYRGLLDGFVLDRADMALAPAVEALGIRALVTDTVMTSPAVAAVLAGRVLEFARALE